MGNFIFFIIVLVVIVSKIMKFAQTVKQNSSYDDDWDAWDPQNSAPPQPTPYQQQAAPPPPPPGHHGGGLRTHFDVQQAQAEQKKTDAQEAIAAALAKAAENTESTEVFQHSLKSAFPDVVKKAKRMSRTGNRTPISVMIRGRSDMRKAVVLNEVLMRPRAFDV